MKGKKLEKIVKHAARLIGSLEYMRLRRTLDWEKKREDAIFPVQSTSILLWKKIDSSNQKGHPVLVISLCVSINGFFKLFWPRLISVITNYTIKALGRLTGKI